MSLQDTHAHNELIASFNALSKHSTQIRSGAHPDISAQTEEVGSAFDRAFFHGCRSTLMPRDPTDTKHTPLLSCITLNNTESPQTILGPALATLITRWKDQHVMGFGALNENQYLVSDIKRCILHPKMQATMTRRKYRAWACQSKVHRIKIWSASSMVNSLHMKCVTAQPNKGTHATLFILLGWCDEYSDLMKHVISPQMVLGNASCVVVGCPEIHSTFTEWRDSRFESIKHRSAPWMIQDVRLSAQK
jgi:hypothetical protein